MRTIEKWNDGVRNKFVQTLTPRLQKDLEKYKEPDVFISDELIISRYYWGDVGTGKTVRAAQLLVEEAKRLYLNPKDDYTFMSCIFVSVPELYRQLKSSFDDNIAFNMYMERYRTCHFLVLDDIGAEKASEWALQQLYLIINYRYEYLLTTIITSNKSLDALAEYIEDDRIPARIRRMGKVTQKIKHW